MSTFTHFLARRSQGRTCPVTAPYRLLRVRPTDTQYDSDHHPLPRGIWVAGYQPMVFGTTYLLAGYRDPTTGLWRAHTASDAAGGTATVNGLVAFSASEAYLAADTGRLWHDNGSGLAATILPDNQPGWFSYLIPAIAGGSDTGGFVLFYDQQDFALRNHARYATAPGGTWFTPLVSTPPSTRDLYYSGGSDGAILGGQEVFSLLYTLGPTVPATEDLFTRSGTSVSWLPGLGTYSFLRLRLSGPTSLNIWVLATSETTNQGLIFRNQGTFPGDPWIAHSTPSGTGETAYFWRGLWAGVAPITGNDDSWLCGTTWNFSSQTGDPAVAHWNALTATWDVTVLALNYKMLGANGDGLQDIWALAPDDIWAVGSVCSEFGTGSRSLVVHYDGTAWTERNLPNLG